MRYGENPHQKAALYVPAGLGASGLAAARQLQGKELSYNNLVDLDAAWRLVSEFSGPATVIVKHNNPCGTAEHDSLEQSYLAALACDPVSAFGGVIAFNRAVDEVTQAARRLLQSLETTSPARDREVEATKARQRARERFAGA